MQIPLTRGLVARVDDEDYPLVSAHRWYAQKASRGPGKHYAVTNMIDPRTGKARTLRMHRLLVPGAAQVDHADNDGLNNSRSNLRACTNSQNQWNAQHRSDGKSAYRGVSPMPNGRFQARIGCHGRVRHLGVFRTAEDAAVAYDRAARELFGEFARLNFSATQTATPSATPEWTPGL